MLFILAIAVALTFAGLEPLSPIKNALLGFFHTSDIAQQSQPPDTTYPEQTPSLPKTEPQPPLEKNSPSPAASERSPVTNVAELEKQVHGLINLERSKNGLSVLAWDDELGTVARKHSEDMAKRNYFNHISPEGYSAVDRCKLGGINISQIPGDGVYYLGCAENIFQCTLAETYYYRNGVLSYTEYYSSSEIAELTVREWMNSEGHRNNILTKYWRTEGIGVAISDGGNVYVTQDFN